MHTVPQCLIQPNALYRFRLPTNVPVHKRNEVLKRHCFAQSSEVALSIVSIAKAHAETQNYLRERFRDIFGICPDCAATDVLSLAGFGAYSTNQSPNRGVQVSFACFAPSRFKDVVQGLMADKR